MYNLWLEMHSKQPTKTIDKKESNYFMDVIYNPTNTCKLVKNATKISTTIFHTFFNCSLFNHCTEKVFCNLKLATANTIKRANKVCNKS